MRTEINTEGTIALGNSRVADYLVLTKPELTLLSVLTAMAGFYLGSETIALWAMLHMLVGTALVGAGAGALNQYVERGHDALMRRTENRPLPAGRLSPREVLVFGCVIAFLGIVELVVFTNLLTGFLAVATLVTYLFLYTPLKRITPVSTIVGAVPGALPPVMGWTAARNEISLEAGLLFAILFFWQMPHFLSLAWMYRKDYIRGGYRILTVIDPDGSRTSTQVIGYSTALFFSSLMPIALGSSGIVYTLCSMILGIGFIILGLRLRNQKTNTNARHVFIGSLVYLPVLLIVMVFDKL